MVKFIIFLDGTLRARYWAGDGNTYQRDGAGDWYLENQATRNLEFSAAPPGWDFGDGSPVSPGGGNGGGLEP